MVGTYYLLFRSVQRILELSRDINCQPKELVMVIEKDPVMTMKLLRLLNSAFYSFPRQITSVNQSVVYLGLNTIKNMAITFTAMGVLPEKNSAGFDIQSYLLHSLTTATLTRMICQKFGGEDTVDPADCYIAGLLHAFWKSRHLLHRSGELFNQFCRNFCHTIIRLINNSELSAMARHLHRQNFAYPFYSLL